MNNSEKISKNPFRKTKLGEVIATPLIAKVPVYKSDYKKAYPVYCNTFFDGTEQMINKLQDLDDNSEISLVIDAYMNKSISFQGTLGDIIAVDPSVAWKELN
jgi:uncharacterized alpha/beta hydrolase family protein